MWKLVTWTDLDAQFLRDHHLWTGFRVLNRRKHVARLCQDELLLREKCVWTEFFMLFSGENP